MSKDQQQVSADFQELLNKIMPAISEFSEKYPNVYVAEGHTEGSARSIMTDLVVKAVQDPKATYISLSVMLEIARRMKQK